MFGIRLAVKYAVEGGMSPWIVHQSYQGSAPGCSGVLHQVGRAPLQRNTEVRLRRGWQLGPLPAQYQFQRVPVKGEARMKKKLVNNIIIMDEKRGWYSLVSPFYERLGGLWRCPRNEIGDMLPGGQKCIHLVAVLLFAVTQCRFKPLQIGRRLNTRAKKKKNRFFPEGRGDDSTNQLFASILYPRDRSQQNSNSRVETIYLSIKYRYRSIDRSRKITSD